METRLWGLLPAKDTAFCCNSKNVDNNYIRPSLKIKRAFTGLYVADAGKLGVCYTDRAYASKKKYPWETEKMRMIHQLPMP